MRQNTENVSSSIKAVKNPLMFQIQIEEKMLAEEIESDRSGAYSFSTNKSKGVFFYTKRLLIRECGFHTSFRHYI